MPRPRRTMHGKFISTVSAAVLAVGISATVIPITAQRSSVPPDARNTESRTSRQLDSLPANSQQQSAQDPRGTEQSPLVLKVLPTAKSAQESEEERAQRDDQSSANWSMVRINVLIFI